MSPCNECGAGVVYLQLECVNGVRDWEKCDVERRELHEPGVSKMGGKRISEGFGYRIHVCGEVASDG